MTIVNWEVRKNATNLSLLQIFWLSSVTLTCLLLQLTEALKKRPMQSMTPTQKAAILAFLCNELLTCKAVSGYVSLILMTLIIVKATGI